MRQFLNLQKKQLKQNLENPNPEEQEFIDEIVTLGLCDSVEEIKTNILTFLNHRLFSKFIKLSEEVLAIKDKNKQLV